MKTRRTNLSQDELKRRLHYDPDSGLFKWKIRPCKNMFAGDWAGSIRKDDYVAISIMGTTYQAHNLVWLYVFGRFPLDGLELDHINRLKSDNRLSNLREVTSSQNKRGAKARSSTGYKGVVFLEGNRTRAYKARLNFNKVEYDLGEFLTPEEAHEAYKKKLAELLAAENKEPL